MKRHRQNRSHSNHDRHTAADGFGTDMVLCRMCHGTGTIPMFFGPDKLCPQCGGGGKVPKNRRHR